MEFNKQTSTVRSSASEAIIDQGLRSYMLKVYNYMASGVLLTGFIALAFFKMAVVTSSEGQIIGLTNFGNTIYASGLKWVIMLAPLAVVFYMSFGIAKMSGEAFSAGFLPFLYLMAILSISLGVLNLLPIPVLDGGQLTMLAIEAIRGEPLPTRVENFTYTIGALMVGFLLVFAVTNDIFRWLA